MTDCCYEQINVNGGRTVDNDCSPDGMNIEGEGARLLLNDCEDSRNDLSIKWNIKLKSQIH